MTRLTVPEAQALPRDARGNPVGEITANFRWEEFHCKCFECAMSFEHVVATHWLVTQVLQPLRNQLGRSIHVNSGYRCPTHNVAVNGVPNSQHMQGTAADISVREMAPCCVYEILDGHLLKFYESSGLGNYSSFTHVDLREYSGHRRW